LVSSLGRSLVPGPLGSASDAQGPAETIDGQRGWTGDLGQAAHRGATAPLHLPESILGLHIAEREERVSGRFRKAMRDIEPIANDLDRGVKASDGRPAAPLVGLRHLQGVGECCAGEGAQQRPALAQGEE